MTLPACAVALGLAASAGAESARDRLSDVRSELSEKRREAERYREELGRLEGSIGMERGRAREARSLRNEYESGRRQAVDRRRRLQDQLDGVASDIERRRAETARSAGELLARSWIRTDFYGSSELWASEALGDAVSDRYARLRTLEGRHDALTRQADVAIRSAGLLLKRSRDADEDEREAREAVRGRQRELEAARRRLESAETRIRALEESARELDRLVRRLARKKKSGALARHSLPWPASGRVVARFGKERVSELGTWVVHRGIRLATAPEEKVRAVRPGRVVYAGPFRSYGEVVIVDHGGGIVTVYGHLGSVRPGVGAAVEPGDILGTAGRGGGAADRLVGNPKGRGSVYFEVRKGNEAVDPLKWLIRRTR